MPSMGFIREVTTVAAGFYATKISAGFILPMIGPMAQGNFTRIIAKSAVAFGVSWLGGFMLGARVKESLLMGGALEVAQDAIKTWVSPFVPALAAAEMESYYLPPGNAVSGEGGVGTYFQVGELPSDNYAG
jgi:hypothetical protein